MLSASQIEAQVVLALQTWFPTYLREIERQLELPPTTFDTPRNYSDRNSFDMEAPEPLPKVVVIAAGTVGSPRKDGGGQYSASWRIGIGIAVGAKTEKDSNVLVKGYAAAIRTIMLQNSGLGALNAVDITWTEEAYDDIPVPNPVELVKAASVFFDVDFTNVVTRTFGPTVPDRAPDSYDYGEVEEVFIDVEQEGG
jgi:hypothetical protein